MSGIAPSETARKRTIAWMFVGAQFALIGLMVLGPRDEGFAVSTFGRSVAGTLLVSGALLGLWSALHLGRGLTVSPLPNGATNLVSAGPYRWVRHPMYSAVMLFMAGSATRSGSWLVVSELALLITLFFFKSRWEETQLSEAFDGYGSYSAVTPRFVPRPGRR